MGPLLRRTLRPVPGFSELVNVGGLLVTLLGGGALFGVTLGAGFGLALVSALLCVLAFWAAYQLQRELDRSTPRLSLGELTSETREPVNAPDGSVIGEAFIGRVPVSNELGAANAENVYAELHFTGEGDQKLDIAQRGCWQDAPDEQEITIAGNGRPNKLDLFVSFPTDDFGERAYVRSQEGVVKHRDYCLGGVFRVEVVVRSNHPKALAKRAWRVFAKDIPEIVPDGVMFRGEKAAQEVLDK